MLLTVSTTVTAVAVYPDRARVTRSGRAELTTAVERLIIDDLPLTLDPASLRAAGQGTARVRILSVDVQTRHYRETPAERARELEAQIAAVQDEARVAADEAAVWQAQLAYLNGLRAATAEYARGLALGRLRPEAQAALAETLAQQDGEARAALRAINRRQREQERTLAHLQAQLKALQAERPLQRYRAAIEVAVTADGWFEPELTYVVSNAGWQPLYDARLLQSEREASPRLALTALAQITQRTGEPWLDVALTLSTARPALNQRLPELTPWYVGPRPAPPVRSPMPTPGVSIEMAPVARMAAKAAAAPEAPPPPAPAEVATAAVSAEGIAVTYRVDGRCDIPDDGSPHKTTLALHELMPALDYVTTPKLTDAVFRRLKLRNTTQAPLLEGPVNLFAGEEFIGRNSLPYTPAEDEVELWLGVEERIAVKRELVRRQVDKRLLRDRRQTRYGYRIEVRNLLATAVQVTVRDQIPVSLHEELKIKLEEARPQPQETTDLNLLTWSLRLEPQAVQAITYDFSADQPRALEVVGLPATT